MIRVKAKDVNPIPAPRPLHNSEWPPNYTKVWAWRQHQLEMIRKDPVLMYACLEYYATRPVEWITHWVDTYDPRNAMMELPTRLPFIPFWRQKQSIDWLHGCVQDQENGLEDKSREMGATWIACAYSCWVWRFWPGASVGWGSRKQDLVDKLGDLDSIFEKMRMVIRGLPTFMQPRGFEPLNHMTFMKIVNPENDATITGEAGDNIGRGGRKLFYVKDESAHYERAESVEAALSDNTRCQIDISTVNGIGTVFDRKRQIGIEWAPKRKFEKGQLRVFVMDWSQHPTKTQTWHDIREKQAAEAGLLHVFKQEVDRDAAASLVGIIIKPEWARACVDAHLELGFRDDGPWSAGFDPYDEGGDLHALSVRKGVVLHYCQEWAKGDVGEATREVISQVRDKTPINIQYDCIGIGASVKSEYNRLRSDKKMPLGITMSPWDAGGECLRPESRLIAGDSNTPLNKDFFCNVKAQGWWELARRCERVYRMKVEGIKYPTPSLISFSSKIPNLQSLLRQLSQPVMVKSGDLRLKVDKKPEGARSPNMGDAVMMDYWPIKVPLIITQAALDLAAIPDRNRR